MYTTIGLYLFTTVCAAVIGVIMSIIFDKYYEVEPEIKPTVYPDVHSSMHSSWRDLACCKSWFPFRASSNASWQSFFAISLASFNVHPEGLLLL